MPFSEQYRNQASLLVRVLPFVAMQDCFALKGGTAINLFLRDVPRLSVDIDLTYVPVESRNDSLAAIDTALKRIAEVARAMSPAEDITATAPNAEGAVTRLLARGNGAQIKIEVTPVLRGCVYEPETRTVSATVEESFGFAEMQVSPSQISMAVRSWRRLIVSIRATSLTCATSWPMKALTTNSVAPSSFIC